MELVDEKYNVLGRGRITATKGWMTEDFVPFKGELDFEKPSAKNGYLILKRSNASGMPEHDRAYHIPVILKKKGFLERKPFSIYKWEIIL